MNGMLSMEGIVTIVTPSPKISEKIEKILFAENVKNAIVASTRTSPTPAWNVIFISLALTPCFTMKIIL